MRLDVYVHNVLDPDTARQHSKIIGKLNTILANEDIIMATLDEAVANLESAAAGIASVEDTVEAKFKALAEQIAALSANQTDPAMADRIMAVADLLNAKAAEFAADAAGEQPAA